MKKNISVFCLLLFSLTTLTSAKTIKVPADQPSIQSGISASDDGDTVVVYPGTYFENIILMGKKILLTSRYYENHDVNYILTTVINGSKPTHKDTASCIRIINHEDSTTIIQGFTITGGKGTTWTDEHGAGKYREGGGIIIALSSPAIRNNLIIYNEAINKTGLASAGGGGIRAGDQNPTIINNIIMRNKGLYGGGIVLNYTGAVVKNNIVYQNEGGQDYSGGGIWLNRIYNRKPVLENNTIINNYSVADGGGVYVYNGTSVIIKNNIIWGNVASTQASSSIGIMSGGTASITYSDVQFGLAGEGNINQDPMLDILQKLMLTLGSPCIDAGNPDNSFNDPEDPLKSGFALLPSLGLVRNDMGAYGGKDRNNFPAWKPATRFIILQKSLDFKSVNIGDTGSVKFVSANLGDVNAKIDSIKFKSGKSNFKISRSLPILIAPSLRDTIKINWIPSAEGTMIDTLLIYHNDSTSVNPLIIKLIGKGNPVTDVKEGKVPESFMLMQNYPNPFNPTTVIGYSIPVGTRRSATGRVFVQLKIFDIMGREVAVLVNEEKEVGSYEVKFDGSNMCSGIYLYRISIHADKLADIDFSQTNKMLLLK